MKKLIFIFSIVLLSACSGASDGDKTSFVRHNFKTFSIEVPETFRKVTKEQFANTISEDTVVIFLSKDETQDVIVNANVVKESLNTNASSLEYAKANMLLGSKAVTDYRKVSSDEVEAVGGKTVLHVFRSRNSTTEPLLHFQQTYFARDRVGYTLTCVSKVDDTEGQATCEQMVTSFRFMEL